MLWILFDIVRGVFMECRKISQPPKSTSTTESSIYPLTYPSISFCLKPPLVVKIHKNVMEINDYFFKIALLNFFLIVRYMCWILQPSWTLQLTLPAAQNGETSSTLLPSAGTRIQRRRILLILMLRQELL